MISEAIKEKLLALRNMIYGEGCSEGERDNARRLYDRWLNKYNLTDDDIKPKEITRVWIQYSTRYEKDLLIQIVGHTRNSRQTAFFTRRSWPNHLGFDLTKGQAEVVKNTYTTLKPALKKGLDQYLSAFIQSNNLGIVTDDKNEDISDEDLDELLIIIRMSREIKKTPVIETRKNRLIS